MLWELCEFGTYGNLGEPFQMVYRDNICYVLDIVFRNGCRKHWV
jgi:hypothetical protein